LAAHWLAVVQAAQTLAAQMGVAAAHVALVRHCTHCPPTPTVPAGAQTIPAQAPAPAWSHPTHALPTQNAREGSLQSPAAEHSTQTPAIHTGRPAWQSPFTLHPGAAVSTAASAAVSTDASGAATGAVSEAVSVTATVPVSNETSRAPPSGCSTQRKSAVQTKPSAHGAASLAHLLQSRSTLLQPKRRESARAWRIRGRVSRRTRRTTRPRRPCFMVAPRRRCWRFRMR
jgi:hypothetical protein